MIRYTVPIRLVSVANTRECWQAKAGRAQAHRRAGFLMTPKDVALPAIVTITRIGPKRMDDDNVVSACKALRDSIAQRIGVDDGCDQITWRYGQRVGGRSEYAAEVTIEARA